MRNLKMQAKPLPDARDKPLPKAPDKPLPEAPDRPLPEAPDRPLPEAPDKPLLLVDVDGVISLFGFQGVQPPGGSFHSIDGIPHFLSSRAAEHLLELSPLFELVWASGWEEKANEYLPHLLGLPGPLPHLSFERSVGKSNAHWKLDAIDAYCGTRALAWIDDSFNEACHEWAGRRGVPTLLVQTLPEHGLTHRERGRLARWAKALARGDA